MQKQKQTKKPPSLFSVMQNQNKKNATTEATQNIQRKCAGLTAFISNCHHKPTVISVCYFMTLNMQVVWNYFCWHSITKKDLLMKAENTNIYNTNNKYGLLTR